MTAYTLRVEDIEVGEDVEIPDDAEHVEVEHYATHPTVDGEWTRVERARIKYLEPEG